MHAPAVNQDDFDLLRDYRAWRDGKAFSFCGRYSFLYGPAAKAALLGMENSSEQGYEFRGAIYQSLIGGGGMPYLMLKVTAASTPGTCCCVWPGPAGHACALC